MFQIQATTCEGSSEVVDVLGMCVVPSTPSTTPLEPPLFNTAAVVAPIVSIMIVAFIIAAIIVYKKRYETAKNFALHYCVTRLIVL